MRNRVLQRPAHPRRRAARNLCRTLHQGRRRGSPGSTPRCHTHRGLWRQRERPAHDARRHTCRGSGKRHAAGQGSGTRSHWPQHRQRRGQAHLPDVSRGNQ